MFIYLSIDYQTFYLLTENTNIWIYVVKYLGEYIIFKLNQNRPGAKFFHMNFF